MIPTDYGSASPVSNDYAVLTENGGRREEVVFEFILLCDPTFSKGSSLSEMACTICLVSLDIEVEKFFL